MIVIPSISQSQHQPAIIIHDLIQNIKYRTSRHDFINAIDFMYTRNLQDIPEARIVVKVRMGSICSILGELIHIIAKTRPYHKIIQGFTIDDLIKYGKAERDTDIKELKIKNQKSYMDEFAIVQGLNELAEQRQEDRNERRLQRKHAGKEGGRRLKMRSIKRRAYKKCKCRRTIKK